MHGAEVTPATSARPLPRHTFGIAFDEDRRVAVIYAGRVAGEYSNVNSTGDSWEWNISDARMAPGFG